MHTTRHSVQALRLSACICAHAYTVLVLCSNTLTHLQLVQRHCKTVVCQRLLAAYTILGTEVRSFVVQLLQGIQILADDCRVQ